MSALMFRRCAFATAHASLRMAERYGVVPSEADWGQALLDVTGGAGLLVRREPDRREIWIVRVAGVAALVIYDPQEALFITALSPQMRNSRARQAADHG